MELLSMRVVCMTAIVVTLMTHVNGNGRDSGQQGPPTLPSYNCTYWEKVLNLPWREIRLPHTYDCTRFYECNDRVIIEKICAQRDQTRYDPFKKVCNWNYAVKCITYYDYVKIQEGFYG